MDCPTCESMVDAYVDGELSARDSADFERALESCPGCRERLEAARKMSGLLRELPAERTPDLLRGRIERELRQHGIGPRCIADGLKEIDAADYRKTLRTLLEKKLSQLKGDSEAVKKNKAARYAIGKGYESELVWNMLGNPAED